MNDLMELIKMYRRTGSDEAVAELIKSIYKKVYLRVIQKVCVDDAPDLTQQTILEIIKGLPSFRGGSDAQFFGWVHAIARAVIAKHYQGLERGGYTARPDFKEMARMIDQYALENNMTESEKREMAEVLALLQKADPDTFDLIYRSIVLEESYRVIGEDYGLSAGAVRMRINRFIEEHSGGEI